LELGLSSQALKLLPNSICELGRGEIDSAIGQAPRFISQLTPIPNIYGEPASFYLTEIHSILSMTVHSFVPFLMVSRLKYLIKSLAGSLVSPKLFSFELSPVFDPSLHEAYTNIQLLSSELIANSFDVSKNFSFRKVSANENYE
jgi:hypothetical protein